MRYIHYGGIEAWHDHPRFVFGIRYVYHLFDGRRERLEIGVRIGTTLHTVVI